MVVTPDDVLAHTRQCLVRRLTRILVTSQETTRPRVLVSTLVLEGVSLGAFADATHEGASPAVLPCHAWNSDVWAAFVTYAGLPGLGEPVTDLDPELDAHPLSAPDEPLLDATLRLIRAEGIEALSLERVAQVAQRSADALVSMYGDVGTLVDVLLDRVLSDGFDDLAPLHLDSSERGVRSMAHVVTSSRRTAAYLRALALSGVSLPAWAVDQVRDGQQALAAVDPGTPEGASIWLAALALDGWTLGSAATAYPWPEAIGLDVVDEIRGLAGVA